MAPVEHAQREVGDIVLATVAGTTYLHLVSTIDATTGRVQVGNNPATRVPTTLCGPAGRE